ncbi:hypothetical protein Misp01_72580 [Microtetraspora sp. NBRC 13810]|uniref:LuxR C-terminal-related transcriptional regulator n=1 Tax=Microtetraspora sp. NBRC 13810 TaxID=3030990 RepID=UPI0024A3BA20|nr:LuxR C-terminal-related transcriptional regulator [Microtetraspora sp. NBRC 13810]GLW12130.1 hypothetical protein Misp01_72580 [Microtetraspora sp. NBRC 13810]
MTDRRSGNLAAEMTSFVGRADEVTRGVGLLGEGRLLTVTGPAGSGKSRVALRVAEGLKRRCPEGLWHVELSGLRPAPRPPRDGAPGDAPDALDALDAPDALGGAGDARAGAGGTGGPRSTTPDDGPHVTSLDGGHHVTSLDGGHHVTSLDGGHDVTASGGGHHVAPLDGGHDVTASGGGHGSTPPYGGQGFAAVGGGQGFAAPDGGQGWAAADGGQGFAAVGGGEGSAAAGGGEGFEAGGGRKGERAGGVVGVDEVARVVAGALGLGGEACSADGLARALSGHRALIVLDTCDHLVKEVAALAAALLEGAPRLRLLATGRRPLGVAREEVLRLAPLPLTDAARPDPGSPSMALFADRAVAVDPEFRLTPASASEVAQICRHLDGLPLAIEFAAERMRSLSTGELLHRLRESRPGERFDLLAGAGEAVLPRHRDLRSAVAWSHELCDDGQRAMWRALSGVRGAFDLETAREVFAAGDPGAGTRPGVPDALLADLVARSVVVGEPAPGGCRYRLLEPYRWFGLELRGDAGDEADRWMPVESPSPGRAAGGGARIGLPVTDALSARELQIAELIAEGLSNPQIAAHLQIAKRTVDAHVRNILAKGGLASRTQVAAWFAERDQWVDV